MKGNFPSFSKILLIFSIPLVFGSCAYMNVSGLMAMLATAKLVALFLGLGLELGKFSVFHFLSHLSIKDRPGSWLFLGLIATLLTIITLADVIGYLTLHYTKSGEALKNVKIEYNKIDKEQVRLIKDIENLEQSLAGLPANYAQARIKERKRPEVVKKRNRISQIDEKKAELERQMFSAKILAGPIYLAHQLKVDEQMAIWLIAGILGTISELLFIALTIAASMFWPAPFAYGKFAGTANTSKSKMASARSRQNTANKITSVENCQNAKIGQNKRIMPEKPAVAHGKNNRHEQFHAFLQHNQLDDQKVAEIVGRDNPDTIAKWRSGQRIIPDRALRDLLTWEKRQTAISENAGRLIDLHSRIPAKNNGNKPNSNNADHLTESQPSQPTSTDTLH
jgi:cell division protein FtsB